MLYYDEDEYFEAVQAYEDAEKEAERVTSEVISFERGKLPERSITEEDYAVWDKRESAWEKVLEIARRPTKP